MKTDNHEVIFAIVNSGYAEDVMDIAREQGVRGGTILNARGVAGQEAADGADAQQHPFRDPPQLFLGFDLVDQHKHEGNCID